MTRLTPLPITDFTGGLNLWANQFNLSDNESSEMCNVEIDPRGGFYTRRGWSRWFDGPNIDAASPASVWAPRAADSHTHLDNTRSTYVTNEGRIWHSHDTDLGSFDQLYVTTPGDLLVGAAPHLADFASWSDDVYMACGRNQPTVKHTDYNSAQVFSLTIPSGTDPGEGVSGPSWNNDYTNPVGGHAPRAEHVEAHAGYLFYANLTEDTGAGDVVQATRIRWSHPGGQQEDFAFNDYIDIDTGGGAITAMRSFQDHLLIFKRDSLWALYGYDNDSWQLVQVSQAVGAPTATAITRSETATYFFSTSGRNSIYGYSGGAPVNLGNRLRPVMEQVTVTDNVWIAWVQDRLWCNVAWLEQEAGVGVSNATDTTMFTFEIDHNEQGAWTSHRMSSGSLGPIVVGGAESKPLAVQFNTATDQRAVMELDHHEDAYDVVEQGGVNEPFEAKYATRWIEGGSEAIKSWRRPEFVLRDSGQPVTILVESFRDYAKTPTRTHTLTTNFGGVPFWRDGGYDDPAGDGFDWAGPEWIDQPGTPPRGTRWAASQEGSVIVRTVASNPQGGGFGKARALKLRFSATSGVGWGIDAIGLRVIYRRFTT